MSTTAAPPAHRLLTAHDVAARLGIPLARVYELVREERLPAVRIGRTVRIDPARLDAWLDAGGTGEA